MSEPSLITWPQVVFFGDSLTERAYEPDNGFWATILSNNLVRVADVVTRGFSGYNSRQCLKILPQIFGKSNARNIAALYILLGANDCSLPTSIQHVPLDDYVSNLTKMIEYFQQIGIEKDKIVLLTCPPYYLDEHSKANPGDDILRCEKNAKMYAEACLSLGKKLEVETIDLYQAFANQQNPKELFTDGLHFSRKGAYLFTETVWPSVEKRTKHIPFKLPLWRDFDSV